MRRLPLESLRVLEACVRHANFTRAAGELGVTPGAVSLRIRDLEADLGVRLFDRRGPRVTPTHAGRVLAERMGEAMRIVRAAVETQREGVDPIRVTAPPTFASRWLVPRLPAYHVLPGAAPIKLDVASEPRAGTAFDIAIRTGLGAWAGFDTTALMPMEAAPMLSPQLGARLGSATPKILMELPLLPHPDWSRWFDEVGARPDGLRYYPSDHSTHELDAAAALAGVGAALLPPNLFGSLVREGRLIQPFAHVVRGPEQYHLLSHVGEDRPSVLRFHLWVQETALARDTW